ncbi:MAG TPA: RNA methyltransferase [Burkholderiaceae bacterium]|nr:RNA methyltransferase [Burkholderiaceae bacterium]
MTLVRQITSRHNELLKALRRLRVDPSEARRSAQAWLEGDHLCRALLAHGRRPSRAVITEAGWADDGLAALAREAPEVICIPDTAMRELSGLESPASLGFLLPIDDWPRPQPGRRTVVLDRLQDPGNVGSLLRTAAAMGYAQVLALEGTSALWSPKVLRAGMGAHFGLALAEAARWDDVVALGLPIVGTHLRDATWLHETPLPDSLAWVFGSEGQGMSDQVAAACDLRVRIPQPGGEESLNVAAAAAICLYESNRRAPRSLALPAPEGPAASGLAEPDPSLP